MSPFLKERTLRLRASREGDVLDPYKTHHTKGGERGRFDRYRYWVNHVHFRCRYVFAIALKLRFCFVVHTPGVG